MTRSRVPSSCLPRPISLSRAQPPPTPPNAALGADTHRRCSQHSPRDPGPWGDPQPGHSPCRVSLGLGSRDQGPGSGEPAAGSRQGSPLAAPGHGAQGSPSPLDTRPPNVLGSAAPVWPSAASHALGRLEALPRPGAPPWAGRGRGQAAPNQGRRRGATRPGAGAEGMASTPWGWCPGSAWGPVSVGILDRSPAHVLWGQVSSGVPGMA